MTNFIPLFPLNIVAYPGEPLNLHIFEPRYKQLIQDCLEKEKPFGLPVVVNNQLQEMGTLITIEEVAKTYEDGRMDIKTKGGQIFRILERITTVPGKLYSGAIVNYLDNELTFRESVQQKVITALREFHKLLEVEKDYKKSDDQLLSYDIAHHIGFTLSQEYQLLCLATENQRLEYIYRHLREIIPNLQEREQIVSKIKMNGHFRSLSLDDFNL